MNDSSMIQLALNAILVVAAITAAITVLGIATLVRDRRGSATPVVVTMTSRPGADVRRAA